MSHWAEIDENNIVIRVLVGDNNEADVGEATMKSLGGQWVKTSFNAKIRFNFAGIGFSYDPIDDAFIAPMPQCNHDELTLTDQKQWECSNAEHVVIR